MGGFRGSDDTLEREIATLEAIARLRVRRYAREIRELERDLKGLKLERAKRRARSDVPAAESSVTCTSETGTA